MIQNYFTSNEERNNFQVSISPFDINNILEATLCKIQVSSENFNQSWLNDKYIIKKNISITSSQVFSFHEDEY